MTILSGKITITSEAQLVIPAQYAVGGCTITLRNLDEDNSIYLDGEGVTYETGYELKAKEVITLLLSPVEPLYAASEGDNKVPICYIASGR